MESALPYQIPGPAGGISTQHLTQSATPQRTLLDLFRTAPWCQMLAHINRKIPSSIALLRRNALSNDFAKLSTLPVLIDSVAYVGKDASVLLRDPTGHVRGTIHAQVFEERKGMLERGVVILLNGVNALAYIEESRGFRQGDDVVHLSVQACHVSGVFKGSDDLPPNSSSSRALLDDYEPHARSPKPVVKPPVRRLPLRECNYALPTSRGLQSAPRRGAICQGRAQHPYPGPQSRPASQHRMHHPRYQHHQFQRQHNHNHPPHYQAVSHQKPTHGSNQHKRPFRPSGIRPNLMETCMPSAQKRQNLGCIQQSHFQPRQHPNAVAAITEEQLDSLLGDLDVDAMIAAHGKAASLPAQSASSAGQKPQPEKGQSACTPPVTCRLQLETLDVSLSTAQTDNADTSGDSRSGHTAITISESNPGDGCSQVRTPVNTSKSRKSEQFTDVATPAEQTRFRQNTGHHTISAVDQDMVNNLFDGVDTTDFM